MTVQGETLNLKNKEGFLLDYVVAHAETQAEKTAFVFIGRDGKEEIYSFARLYSSTAQYAGWIGSQTQPGDRVLLALDSGPAYVLSFLGALAVGAIPVPLFPPETAREHHMSRFRAVIADAEPTLILTERDVVAELTALSKTPVVDAYECPTGSRPLAPISPHADDLAFLQYTSGSTSAPKGVMVSHGNIVANAKAMIDAVGVNPDDVVVSWLPIYHDMGLIAKILMPLVAGIKTINMSPKRFLMRPERWLQAISDHRGTISGAPDFAYRLCADVVRERTLSRLDLSAWRVAFSGSEPVRATTLDAFSKRFQPSGFRNEAQLPCYGLAEATLAVTGIGPDHAPSTAKAPGTDQVYVDCGPALSNTEVRTGGPDFDLNRREGVGEVYVHSPSITLGYWKNPQATADSFREIDGKRWLRTGDLGFLADGHLHLTGRAKDLIILDGQNVFPQDIEVFLETNQSSTRSGRVAAYARSQNGVESYGVALEMPGNRLSVAFEDLAREIASELAAMFQHTPTEILLLPPRALPRTSSGKLQRRQTAEIVNDAPELPVFVWRGGTTANDQVLTEFEAQLAKIWSQILGVRVGDPNSNFFVLGGSSVQATRLIARLEQELSLAVDPAALFVEPTLAGMAKRLGSAKPLTRIPEGNSAAMQPVSGLGRYFWFLDRFGFGGVCSVACGVRFSGDLDVGAFEVALGLVVARQEALRLRFSEASDGGLTCRAVPPNEAQIVLQQVDLSGFDADVAEARLAALSEQDAGDRIDLLNGPGWRATLVHMPQGQALLLTLHHILCDGWSMGILQSDLLAALAGEAGAPLSPGYLDVQRWQAALAEAGAGQDSLDWWLEVFGNAAPDRLELPTDRSRPAQRSWRGGRIEQEIPADLAARLRALAQARGATLQQVLMAGWVALLHRLTGAQDLCVGLPVAGRSRAEMQAMIGLFVNTLPLPVTVDPREGFSGLVDRVRGQSAEALAHQDVSLEALTAALRGEDADASRPLFDVVHAHQPLMADRITLPDGQEAQGFARSTGAQQFDLALETVESADGPIAAALGYDVDLFGAATPTRWLAAWIDLLAAGVAAPDRALDLIDLRSPAEAAQLPAPWPDSQAQADTLVPAAVAAQDPTRVAIVFDGVETSYGALNAMANQVAHALLARGLTPESRVGVCLPRGAQAIAACLGVMRAGCAFVPLDPTHPEDRRAYILDDSAAALVIADKEAGIDTLFPDDINGPETDPAAELSPDQLAYVIYTSGSTGQPKGVAVEHGPLAMHVATTAAAYEMGADCRELHMLSLAFDGAHERWMVPFWLGGAIVMRPDALWSGAETLQVMADQSVTNAGFPTALLHQVADAARGSEAPPVQMYSFGGEAMPRAGFDLVAQALQPELMINGYGPTECVISPMIWKAQPGSEAAQFDTPNAPIGRPVGARRAYVLDDRLRPVLPGQPGELYLAGGLARGYLGRPGQTARVFLPDPFGTPGSRMYRTGDRVRQRADGVIEYLGRADRQIKLRGYRIEPGEIEARLMACEEVAQAHVARVDQDHGPLLAAWVTPAQGANPDEASLQRRLAADLPAYMVPAQIETLTAFPKTPNGKTDTKALRLTPRAQPASQTDETLTQTEAKIADIWTQILKTKPNKKSNFFKQGGDSIKAIQLSTHLGREGIDVSLKAIFEKLTLEAISSAAMNTRKPQEVVKPGQAELTPIQRWFFERDDPTPEHWNQFVCLGVDASVDDATLEAALGKLTSVHEVFRTAFRKDSGVWHAEIREKESPVKLAKCFEADLPVYLARAHESLSLESGDLFRAIRTNGESDRLYLIAHHLIVDGISWRILIEDLELLLSGRDEITTGGSPSLWAKGVIQTHVPEKVTAGWYATSKLIKPLPVDNPDSANTALRLRTVQRTIGHQTTMSAKQVGLRPYKADLQTIMLSALAQSLWGWTGERQTVIAVETHGRTNVVPVPDRSVGWFTSVAPVVVAAGSESDSICATKEAHASALEFAPLFNKWRLENQAPAARIAFNHLGENQPAEGTLRLDMSRSGLSMGPQSPIETDICLNSWISEGQLHLDWEFASDRLAQSTVLELAEQFESAFERLIEHCRAAVPRATSSDYPLAQLSQHDLDQLQPGHNGISDIYPVTSMQAGMLFHSEIETDDPYVSQMRLDLRNLDGDRFIQAWKQVTERHDVFRTGFIASAQTGQYLQLVHKTLQVDIRQIHSCGDVDTEIKKAMAEDKARGFDLSSPPLSRLTLIETEGGSAHAIWTCHHLLTDGWSLGVFLAEVSRQYESPSSELPTAPRFKDHVAQLQAREFDAAFWRAELSELESPTRLADAFATPNEGRSTQIVVLDKTLQASLEDATQRLGVTTNTLFQAALAVVLKRYQYETTVSFGVTTSGRSQGADDNAVGLFISTLPMIVDMSDTALSDWLAGIQHTGLALLEHEGDPLTSIAAQAPQRGGELFDTLLVFENYPLDAALVGQSDASFRIDGYEAEERTNYPLTISVIPGETLSLRLAANAGVFGPEGLQRIKTELIAALSELVDPVRRTVSDIRSALADPIALPELPQAPSGTLAQAFSKIALQQPGAPALQCESERLTYAELDHMANAAAHQLIASGVRPGDYVGLACERSVELVAGMLGILKAGAAYVPLDPANPIERLRFIKEDAGLSTIVCDSSLPDGFEGALVPDYSIPVVTAPDVVSGDVAYVIYTSGSTGRPKGVEVTHSNALHLLTRNTYDFGPNDVWTAFHAYSFDFSVWEIFGALLSGGEVVIVPYVISRDPQATAQLLGDAGVTVFCQTPTAFQQILPEILRQPALPLRHLFLGAETVDLSMLEPVWQRFPSLRVYNLYGPTEATVFVAKHEILAEDLQHRAHAPLGRATDGTALLLLDDLGIPVSAGATGEIHVAGPAVTRGYLGRTDLTERSFPQRDGSRLYRTGDLARLAPDGLLEFKGRADQQVKLRGFRIELGEIEAVLRSQPGVTEAVVVLHQDQGLTDLAAYVSGVVPDDLRSRLASELPPHMVPRWITALDTMPMNANGKLDRSALPRPQSNRRVGRPPSTEMERALAVHWENLLGVTQVFADDDFFSLGGHSLLATRLRAALENELGLSLPLKTVFEKRQLSTLAKALEEMAAPHDNFDDLADLMSELETE